MSSSSRLPLQLTIGSDPELMLFSKVTNNLASAIRVLNNSKEKPSDLGDGIKMYADNVLVEAAFPPANSKEQFIETLRTALRRMQKALGSDYKLMAQAAIEFPQEELLDERAWAMGCNPNHDVYAGAMNEPSGFKSALRTGSFHIHVGNLHWKEPTLHHGLLMTPESKSLAIKLLDIFVGCPSVIFDRDHSSISRRKLYGKAGEFRPTPYGIEYRVLGNYAIRSPDHVSLVLDLVKMAMEHIAAGTGEEVLRMVSSELVREAINTGSSVAANQVMAKVRLPNEICQKCWREIPADMYRTWGIA